MALKFICILVYILEREEVEVGEISDFYSLVDHYVKFHMFLS